MKHICLTKQCGLFGGGELAAVDGYDVCRMEATEGLVDGVFHLFGYWGVEIFLFVSGFGIVYSLYRNDVRVMVQFQWEVPYLNLLLVFATPSMCILACIVTHLFRKCKCDGVLAYIGKHSLELYLWHEFVYWNLYRNAMFECMNRYVLFLLAVGISFLLAWVTSHLIKHSIRFR